MIRIDLAPAKGREYTYTALGVTHTGGTNGLHDFCRKLVADGHAGPATVYGPNGAPRLVIRGVERLAKIDLEETPSQGFRERPHRDRTNPFAARGGDAQDGA